MNKATYLSMPFVEEFIAFMVKKLIGEPFAHEFVVRDKRLPRDYQWLEDGLLKITSLQDAYQKYWWDRLDYAGNKEKLGQVKEHVLAAMNAENQPDAIVLALSAISKVLEWGAGGKGQKLYVANMDWAQKNSRRIVPLLQSGRNVMSSDTPNISVFGRDGPRMNAGFTKYYALACKDVVIYDGRVGAALGLLVREFCRFLRVGTVPAELEFLWGAQNPGIRGTEQALPRDPSSGGLIFHKLPTSGGPQWAWANIRANWILESAQKRSKAEWCSGADGLRKIEAALFTIGYRIPPCISAQQ